MFSYDVDYKYQKIGRFEITDYESEKSRNTKMFCN